MLRSLVLYAIVAILFLPACGGGTSDPIRASRADLWVDALTGSDANSGLARAPLRTISRALEIVVAGATIQVAPGLYDVAHGETFPLRVPAAVELRGDPGSWGTGNGLGDTAIVGQAQYRPGTPEATASLDPGTGVRIAGFRIGYPSGPGVPATGTGVVVRNGDVSIEQCTFGGFDHGVLFERSPGTVVDPAGGVVAGNVIRDCDIGVLFRGPAPGTRVSSNWINHTLSGIMLEGPGPDLGGGNAGSAGLNTFACNLTDIHAQTFQAGQPYTISAQANFWDALPVVVATNLGAGYPDVLLGLGATVLLNSSLGGASCP